MSDKMLRVSGRFEDANGLGYAKAIKTTENGQTINVLAGSQAEQLASTTNIISGGGATNVSFQANRHLSKTIYAISNKGGYAGLEVELNGEWYPYLKARDEYLRDYFEGVDNPVDAVKWAVNKTGTFNETSTFAKEQNGQLVIGVRSNASYSSVFLTSKKKITTTLERIMSFTIDETEYPVGNTAEFILGLIPTLPVDTGQIAGRVYLMRLTTNKVIFPGGEYPITPKAKANYTIVFSPTTSKIYRDGELIGSPTIALVEPEYHVSLQLTATTSALARTAHLDEIVVWSKREDAKVQPGEMWIKSTSDAMPSNMRVVFQNDIGTPNNEVMICVVGQP